MKINFLSLAFGLAFLSLGACTKDKTQPYVEDGGVVVGADIIWVGSGDKQSSFGDTESHNMGLACATCHKSGGPGEGVFSIGGTVYHEDLSSAYPNTTLKLYTGPGGTGDLKYTFEVDGRGNFYSTTTLNVLTGLYPAVEGATTTKYMGSPVKTGMCSSCHGNTTDKIWTK